MQDDTSMYSSRPHNLDELMQKEELEIESLSSIFTLDDISRDEDIWIMNIPKSINPQELQGQKITLGDKAKIKYKGQQYQAINHNVTSDITCVFNTEKATAKYKTINIKPTGVLTLKKKLSGATKIKVLNLGNHVVPFPSNIKREHSLVDASDNNLQLFMENEKKKKLSKKDKSLNR